MSNPRIEEVEDDESIGDPEEMDLEEFDFARPQKGGLQPKRGATSVSSDEDDMMQEIISKSAQPGNTGSTQVPQMPRMSERERERYHAEQIEKSKPYQSLYPVYFDSTRSRDQGRRVSKVDAVPNPLAREIVDALSNIGAQTGVALQIVFEPTKTHPKDWANPGRVKVLIKKDGKPISAKIQNSEYRGRCDTRLSKLTRSLEHHLYKMISKYLKSHPTTAETPKKLQIQGLPTPPKDAIPAPSVPRGFKIGTILPLHSPALSGGGVSDNMFKNMMEDLSGQMPGLAGAMGGGDGGAQAQKKVKASKKK
jgi:signal recognition particle subunit SRP19